MRRRGRLALAIGLGAVFLGLIASGWTEVGPGEVVVVRRWGRLLDRPWAQGLHWALPMGIDRTDRVRTDAVRRLEVGLAGTPGPGDDPGAGEFLTGDINLIIVRGVIQYRVADPPAFALRSADAKRLLTRSAEAALTRALSRVGIDAALREGRPLAAREVEADLARSADRLGLGVAILGVSLTDARPPAEVQADFDAAQSAQSGRDRRLQEAQSYGDATLFHADAAGHSRIDAAHADADRTAALARAKAEAFLALLAEADRSRRLTVRRIYLDALRDILPRVGRKLVLTPDEPVDLSILGAER